MYFLELIEICSNLALSLTSLEEALSSPIQFKMSQRESFKSEKPFPHKDAEIFPCPANLFKQIFTTVVSRP